MGFVSLIRPVGEPPFVFRFNEFDCLLSWPLTSQAGFRELKQLFRLTLFQFYPFTNTFYDSPVRLVITYIALFHATLFPKVLIPTSYRNYTGAKKDEK